MLPRGDMFARTFGEHRGERSGDVRLPDPTRPDPTRYIPSAGLTAWHQSVTRARRASEAEARRESDAMRRGTR